MDPNRCSRPAAYEGQVRVRWCESCFGWHAKRQWEQSSASSSANFWLGSGEHLWVPANDLADRAMYKFVTGMTMTTRILQTADDAGQELLGLDDEVAR